MKHLILKTKYVILALLVTFSFSCSDDGEQGPQGQTGVAEADGANGNANVQTLTFDASAFSGTFDMVTIPEITQDVLDNDAILGYLTDDGTNWVTIPCPFDNFQFDFSVLVTKYLGFMNLDYGDANGNGLSITAGDLQSLKVIIIESTKYNCIWKYNCI